ncbi:hypothetical protein A7K94_0221875, partial [Modestobacter sp. VKM Ac-2676]
MASPPTWCGCRPADRTAHRPERAEPGPEGGDRGPHLRGGGRLDRQGGEQRRHSSGSSPRRATGPAAVGLGGRHRQGQPGLPDGCLGE